MPNICILGQSERLWNFEIITASVTSSDESKVNGSIHVNRISFSETVVSANVYWNCDADDDSTANFVLLYIRNGLNTSIQVNRISFSESVASARVNWNCDTDEKSTAKMLLWHCRNGRESDYTLTPYQIPNQSLKTFVDTYYHDMLYLNVANCSNLPPYVDLSDLKKEYIHI
ncbi:uncharacterized protein LOC133839536 [Drosophila sulfurigaster albostrigata]|uniref:uncharacterized protein LOC133839536 n=1 Tax=Drosophila sulfurigaster albostrigata TaxID=89887 RepID=UPI002D21D5B7|nr:uncharacterized protein LOC133839536 [Drosophila sulfurigaster albostrigata]